MKLTHFDMDSLMDGMSMEKDATPAPPDKVATRIAGLNTYLQLTPNVASNAKPRRSAVSVACERCRKRKTKCSGLPGPCTNCVRLNVPCHEPGRRRSNIQSALDERMQRLRMLTAAQHGTPDPMRPQEGQGQLLTPDSRQTPSLVLGQHGGIQASSLFDFRVPSPSSINSSEGWVAAENPASYFDSRLQETLNWTMSDISLESESRPNIESATSDFNQQPIAYATLDDPMRSYNRSGLENISTTITSEPSTAQPQSPVARRERTPIGFTISYDSTYFDDADLGVSTSNAASPSSIGHETNLDDEDTRLSRQVSSAPRQSSKSSPTISIHPLHISTENVSEQGSSSYQLTRSSTVPTPNPTVAEPSRLHETGLLDLIIRSSDTQKYVQVYFSSVHNEYPFLNPSIFGSRASLVELFPNINYNVVQQQTILQFQALLVAAIGALVKHESINLSSQYVKQALSIQDQFEMWSSVGGIHCGILLALYCHLAQVMVYDTRQDENSESRQPFGSAQRQNRYPVSNLWLHNCQIAAACIDLGMHQPLAMQEQIRSHPDVRGYLEACLNTIRSAYILDQKISELRNRPRAFHDEDIDQTLLADIR